MKHPLYPLESGDRVVIVANHPHATEAGSLVAFEEYGPGARGTATAGLRWLGWRIALDAGGECYASPVNLKRTA
jgi:hypothetical protein